MITKIVLLLIICLLLVADYAMLVVASRSERRADEMYRRHRQITERDLEVLREWAKESKDERVDSKRERA